MNLKHIILLGWLTCCPVWATAAEAPDILTGLRPEHPRLLITSNDWAGLRAPPAADVELAAILAKTVSDARLVLSAPPLVYRKEGKRLLGVSREAERRILLCSFSYRLTGDKVFLDRAQTDMLAVAAFNDWNPSHFLDTAEMTAALALGYDWLFSDLSPAARGAIQTAILEKGLKPGLTATDGHNWWQTSDMNWNQVCFGGLTLGALAIAEEQPGLAREFLKLARKNNPHGLKPYVPDGIYPEGPGYWNYGTTYQVLMLAALQTALGTDWQLAASPGFLASAGVLVEQTGPTGRPFNFSDGGDGPSFDPALFWFAKQFHQPGLVYGQNKILRQKLAKTKAEAGGDRLFPLLAAWAGGLPGEIPPLALPLAWHGGGPNPVGVFRSSWTDTNALFLAFKGGSARLNHAHMDAGSFVLDAEGVRWACDLGAQDYLSIESKGWDLFKMAQNSDRWRVYRLNNFSHNTLTLGGQLHRMTGDARITAFTTNSATVDLSQIFAGQASRVVRHFSIGDSNTVVVSDALAGCQPGLSVRWQMVTHANISLQADQATLRQSGKVMTAKILSPAGAQFEIASAQPPADGVNVANPGASILAVNLEVPADGNLTVTIQLQPGNPPADR